MNWTKEKRQKAWRSWCRITSNGFRSSKRFILLAPTARSLDGQCQQLLAAAKAAFFLLDTTVTLAAGGTFRAAKNPLELFAAFLPAATEPPPENIARQLFALLEELATERICRKAPIATVFHFSCVKSLTRAEVAIKCGCVPALITLRIKWIQKKLGLKLAAIRQLSPQFEQIEASLTAPRARKIYRPAAIYGDSSDDEQDR
jgi:hypothetical protein